MGLQVALFPLLKGITTKKPLDPDTTNAVPVALFPLLKGITTRGGSLRQTFWASLPLHYFRYWRELRPNGMTSFKNLKAIVALFPLLKGITTRQLFQIYFNSIPVALFPLLKGITTLMRLLL